MFKRIRSWSQKVLSQSICSLIVVNFIFGLGLFPKVTKLLGNLSSVFYLLPLVLQGTYRLEMEFSRDRIHLPRPLTVGSLSLAFQATNLAVLSAHCKDSNWSLWVFKSSTLLRQNLTRGQVSMLVFENSLEKWSLGSGSLWLIEILHSTSPGTALVCAFIPHQRDG